MTQSPFQYRHGDVLIAPVAALPAGSVPRTGLVLAHGEHTGHSHRIREFGAASLYVYGKDLYLLVSAPKATLVHEEHRPIELPVGVYRVWQQREYTPSAIRTVVD
ncbi:hypothetical protein [Hymenobacter cellulosivorans]|uniref:Uncharacterized protein n=1 Tax=Hymenobacter cellulosivorans TaxID=2932249 RepID=A0ABY4FH85_9BACT|nr:hypothetical protein [Hymenobacter cellulosivorans]UOQ53831.1 hypothetical protein MUN80_03495 [Hymenobacter cellulosivorans]